MSDTLVRSAPAVRFSNRRFSAYQQAVGKPRKRKAFAPPGPGKIRQAETIKKLTKALLAQGYRPGSERTAEILGMKGRRSTLWAMFNSEHKRGGLSSKTVKRLLSAKRLPKGIRKILTRYLRERLAGLYGHSNREIAAFRLGLGLNLSRAEHHD